MAAIDWQKIYREHRGRWVALKSDERTVVASGKTLKEARSKALRGGYAKPIMAKMPSDLTTYIG